MNLSMKPLMSAKIWKTASKGCNRSQKGARNAAMGQAIKTRRMSPTKSKFSNGQRKTMIQVRVGWNFLMEWRALFFGLEEVVTYSRASSTDFLP